MTPKEKIAALRDALEKNAPHCEAEGCNAIATWNERDYDVNEYYCDEHMEVQIKVHFARRSHFDELEYARLAIAVLDETK